MTRSILRIFLASLSLSGFAMLIGVAIFATAPTIDKVSVVMLITLCSTLWLAFDAAVIQDNLDRAGIFLGKQSFFKCFFVHGTTWKQARAGAHEAKPFVEKKLAAERTWPPKEFEELLQRADAEGCRQLIDALLRAGQEQSARATLARIRLLNFRAKSCGIQENVRRQLSVGQLDAATAMIDSAEKGQMGIEKQRLQGGGR